MIAGQNDALRAQQRNPAARLGTLTGLVDDQQIKTPPTDDLAVQAGRGAAQNRCSVENPLQGLGLQLAGIAEQSTAFLAQRIACTGLRFGSGPLAGLTKESERLLGQLACLPHI